MRLKGATKSIDELMSIIDEDNREFKGEIDDCYKELDRIAIERKTLSIPIIPGTEISKMLRDWHERNENTNIS